MMTAYLVFIIVDDYVALLTSYRNDYPWCIRKITAAYVSATLEIGYPFIASGIALHHVAGSSLVEALLQCNRHSFSVIRYAWESIVAYGFLRFKLTCQCAVGMMAGEHKEKHTSKRVDVRPIVDRVAIGLLRAHITTGTYHSAIGCASLIVHILCYAKIEQTNITVRTYHNI